MYGVDINQNLSLFLLVWLELRSEIFKYYIEYIGLNFINIRYQNGRFFDQQRIQ